MQKMRKFRSLTHEWPGSGSLQIFSKELLILLLQLFPHCTRNIVSHNHVAKEAPKWYHRLPQQHMYVLSFFCF